MVKGHGESRYHVAYVQGKAWIASLFVAVSTSKLTPPPDKRVPHHGLPFPIRSSHHTREFTPTLESLLPF